MAKTYNSGATNFMETGSVKKALFTLGIPSMVAVTVAYPIFMMISVLCQFVGVGVSSLAWGMHGNKRNDIAAIW